MGDGQALTEEILMFEEHRNDYIDILRELRKKHPNIKMQSLENLAEAEVMNRGPKSRAYYRVQATRKLTGGGHLNKAKSEKERQQSGGVLLFSYLLATLETIQSMGILSG